MQEQDINKYFIILLLCLAVYLTSYALAPFITGFLLAYLLFPLERKLVKYVKNSIISSIIIIFILISVASFGTWFFSQFIYGEFLDILNKMPPATAKLFTFLGIKMDIGVNSAFEELNKNFSFQDIISKIISYFFILLYRVLKGNFSFLFEVFSFCYITPVSTIIFLANMHKIDKIAFKFLAYETYCKAYQLVSLMNHLLKKYLFSQLAISILHIIFYYIMLNAIGITRIKFLLFIIFVTSFIPSFGSLCGVLTFLLITFIENTPLTQGLIVFIGGYIYENNCLIPYFIGKNLGISGFIIWCSVILGGKLLGIGGLFFGIPIGALLYELFKESNEKNHSSHT